MGDTHDQVNKSLDTHQQSQRSYIKVDDEKLQSQGKSKAEQLKDYFNKSAIGKADAHDKNIEKIQRQATETEGHAGLIDSHHIGTDKRVDTTIPEKDLEIDSPEKTKSQILKEYYEKNSIGLAQKDNTKVEQIRNQAMESSRRGELTDSMFVINSQVR